MCLGFISIDCRSPADLNYTESTTGINYTSDANFINTGVSGTIVSELRNEALNIWSRLVFCMETMMAPQPKSLLFISQENGFSVFTTFNFGFWLGIGIVGLLDAFNWVQVTIFKLVCKDCVTWAPDFWFSLSIPLFPYKILEDSTNCQYLPLFPIWKFNVGISIAFCISSSRVLLVSRF